MIKTTEIKDVKVFKPKIFSDNRGYVFESYNEKVFNKYVKDFFPIQDNESKSNFGVLRGIHFQKSPFEQAKLVRVIKGKVQDIAVDLRPNSKTYKKYISVILSDENKNQIFIPKGFGHAFLTLSNEAIVSYKVNCYYNRESEFGYKFDDPSINIKWELNHDEIILSEKDEKLTYL